MKRLLILLVIIFLSAPLWAQEQTMEIYSGMDDATSIYATKDHLFVIESGKDRLLKLDHSGKLLQTLGGLGTGDYQFDTPISVDATNGLKIYISDSRNGRIQIYDRRFQYLGSIVSDNDRKLLPTKLVVNSLGEVIFYDETSRAFLKYDESGTLLDKFSTPPGLRSISDMQIEGNMIEIYDRDSGMLFRISDNGLLRSSFPFRYPVDDFKNIRSFVETGEAVYILTEKSLHKMIK